MKKDKIEPGIDKEDFQDSQRGLINHDTPSPLETVDERLEDLDIEMIQHFTGILDYKTPTDSKHPILVKTPLALFCLDGWNLIEEAKANGKSIITCAVEYLGDHSEEELAIRKVALRVRPRGGIGSYSEIIRNTKRLEEILLASNKDLKVFTHGGTRKGEAFINNKQENVRKIIASRLGKSVSTVNQYLNHGLYLNEDTMNFLADKGVSKDFFEEAQKSKRVEVIRMMSERLSDTEITNRISGEILEWHKEYQNDGKIRPVWNGENPDTEEESENHVEAPQEAMVREVKQEIFNPWCGSTEIIEEDSFEKVKQDTEDLAKKLLEAASLADPNRFYEHIMEEASLFYRISKRAAQFRNI